MELLYHRYRDWVYWTAFRWCQNREDSLDVLQDVFSYLFGKFPGFVLTSSLKTFLYPVIRSHSVDLLRKRGRTVPLLNGVQEAKAAPEVRDPEQDRARIQEQVAHLPAGQREVIVLRFVDELSLVEIAQALDIPVGTVKSRLHHALATLRKEEENP